jgi:hypothetical protein
LTRGPSFGGSASPFLPDGRKALTAGSKDGRLAGNALPAPDRGVDGSVRIIAPVAALELMRAKQPQIAGTADRAI